MGGGVDRKNEALSVRMANELIQAAESVGADTLVSVDPRCLMHLQGVIAKQGKNLRVVHLADVLASGWE
jgi:L-lactate dehydrogenase complex protein LldE